MSLILAIALATVAPAPQGAGTNVVTQSQQESVSGASLAPRATGTGDSSVGAARTGSAPCPVATETGNTSHRLPVAERQAPLDSAASAVKPQPGWPESGEMNLSFAAARKKLAVKLAKRGWRHVHTIELGKDRKLESWDRGGEELTLMAWRIGTGKTGYSLGITKKGGK